MCLLDAIFDDVKSFSDTASSRLSVGSRDEALSLVDRLDFWDADWTDKDLQELLAVAPHLPALREVNMLSGNDR